jgi:hypothetical protein
LPQRHAPDYGGGSVVPHDAQLRASPTLPRDGNFIDASHRIGRRLVRMNDAPRCRRCRDVIGVYEPLVLLVDGGLRETSRAADPDVTALDGDLYHRSCYAQLVEADSVDGTVA